uniref:NADH-ubiquinone oxidoreductase chain 2 n=1 Tax=Laevipilina antarctica TaxID=358449 RepID=A0A1L6BZZ1_9MOLL|nr:NADH dehydrogenase subunit 2 [Laevipilina antarctica]APQ42968.1 NADH dehydrogenase subunit 2 [Laevipilina antarctica]
MVLVGSWEAICSSHWVCVWLGLEINVIGFVPMMVYSGSFQEIESGMKYFLIQGLGSGIMLFGGLSLYWSYGGLEVYLSSNYQSLLICISMLLKMGVAPFHFWLPGVVGGCNWVSCFLLLTWQKIAPLLFFGSYLSFYFGYFGLVAVLSALFGGIGGMNQSSLRGVLVYSSIVHMGWLILCCKCGMFFVYLYYSMYVFSLCWVFLLVVFNMMKGVSDAYNFYEGSWGQQVMMMISLLSLGGLPPFIGFFAKLCVMIGAAEEYLGLGLICVLGSVLSLYYYLSLFFSVSFSFGGMKHGSGGWEMGVFEKIVCLIWGGVVPFGLILGFWFQLGGG